MSMKIIGRKACLCPCCMEEHEVKTVVMQEQSTFKNAKVEYEAVYQYCDRAEELYMNEEQMKANDMAMKDAYRRKKGFLTSAELMSIRQKYKISQVDLCILLGWGEKTITRYEGHQVQDRAHDTILRKIDHDPEWMLELLQESKEQLASERYYKYYEVISALYEKEQDMYLRKVIEAKYAKFQDNKMIQGNTELSLDKTVDMIRYFAASSQITVLYKVKLMKLMWYADTAAYKKRGKAISGLAYQAMPMGAVPVGHDILIDLKGVPCEEVDMGESNAYHFSLKHSDGFPALSEEEREILDYVIEKLGKMSKNEIVSFMHNERAYKNTEARKIILFQYAYDLQI